jgi:hypothetical protein
MNRSKSTKAAATKETHEEEMLRRIIDIDHKTDSMNDSIHWLVRGGDTLKDTMVAAFNRSKRRVQVYLALNGTKNVNAIASSLKMQRQNVTAELRWLKRKQLIAIANTKGNEVIYCKPKVDSVIGLSHELMEKFGLNRLGQIKK